MMQQKAYRIMSGRKAVSVPGTPVPLVDAQTECFKVIVSADLGNSNHIVIGDENINATEGSQKGAVLVPGNSPIEIDINDVSKLYVDAQTAGDAVSFVYLTT